MSRHFRTLLLLQFSAKIWATCILLFFSVLLCFGPLALADEDSKVMVGIIVSRPIRPYLVVSSSVNNLLSKQSGARVKLFSMDNGYDARSMKALGKEIRSANPDLLVTVGPEALTFAGKYMDGKKVVYTMVFNPEKLGPHGCGVSLKIPVSLQVGVIEAALPSIRKVGILYDPRYNEDFVKAAMTTTERGLAIVPLAVSSRKDISSTLSANWGKMDALWLIPDLTVISEGIVRHIIRQGLSEGVAVIGYNRFFYRNGAVLSFVLDYDAIGRQTAELCMMLLSGASCRPADPSYKALINARIAGTLGVTVHYEPSRGIEKGP